MKQIDLCGNVRTRVVNQYGTSTFDVYIGRADGGKSHLMNTPISDPGWLGNPYRLSDGYTRERSIELFRHDFNWRLQQPAFREAVEELHGQTLACHCKPKACHGDVIAEHLNSNE